MPGVFISYRRGDASAEAGRLSDQLGRRFGEDRVFIDVDGIPVGEDFTEKIETALAGSDVQLVVIGPGWLDAAHIDGRRRLDDPQDFVRREIEGALQRDIRLVPVLVRGANMPAADRLPPSIAPLANRQAHELTHRRWRKDVEDLAASIRAPGAASEHRERLERMLGRHRRAAIIGAAAAVAAIVALLAVLLIGGGDPEVPGYVPEVRAIAADYEAEIGPLNEAVADVPQNPEAALDAIQAVTDQRRRARREFLALETFPGQATIVEAMRLAIGADLKYEQYARTQLPRFREQGDDISRGVRDRKEQFRAVFNAHLAELGEPPLPPF